MENQKKQPKGKKDPLPLNPYLKYSTLAFQIGGIIILGVWLGDWLDATYRPQAETPVYTIIFSLLFVFIALYVSLKDFIKPQK
jgi:hypothetical protein